MTLNERVAATLEIESGVNDPMAVYLTLAFIALLALPAPPAGVVGVGGARSASCSSSASAPLRGRAGGFAMAALLRRVAARDAGGGILALLIGAGGLAMFAATGLLGGSGFLAVYLFGLIVANRAAAVVAPTLAAMDGYAWLAQAGMFLLLGLLVTPSTMLHAAGPGLACRAGADASSPGPRRCGSACCRFASAPARPGSSPGSGLRGAVPIVLALFPADGRRAAGAAAVQHRLRGRAGVAADAGHHHRLGGAPAAAWRCPTPDDERRARAVFRDFALDPAVPVGAVCEFYGLPAPAEPQPRSATGWPPRCSARRWSATACVSGRPRWWCGRFRDGRIAAIGLGLPD